MRVCGEKRLQERTLVVALVLFLYIWFTREGGTTDGCLWMCFQGLQQEGWSWTGGLEVKGNGGNGSSHSLILVQVWLRVEVQASTLRSDVGSKYSSSRHDTIR